MLRCGVTCPQIDKTIFVLLKGGILVLLHLLTVYKLDTLCRSVANVVQINGDKVYRL